MVIKDTQILKDILTHTHRHIHKALYYTIMRNDENIYVITQRCKICENQL